jgi:hypothetical protein
MDSQSSPISLASALAESLAVVVPWPIPLDASESSGTMALPAVALEERTLHMWYGERSGPTLKLQSIDVAGP